MRSTTTAGAAGAGAAFGSILAWVVGLAAGVEVPPPITGAFATLGAFAFGVYLPRPRRRR